MVKQIGGKYNIYKVDCNMSDVISFACSREATSIITRGENNTNPSIIPGKPNEEGLIHFFKKENGWNFVSESEYQEKKGEIPNLCYACRNPIKNFQERQFPDLSLLVQEL